MKHESDEKLLSALKALTESDENKCAPPSVEASLREYFLSVQPSQRDLSPEKQSIWKIFTLKPMMGAGAFMTALLLVMLGLMFNQDNGEIILPAAPSSPPPQIVSNKDVNTKPASNINIGRHRKTIPVYAVEKIIVKVSSAEITTNFIYTGTEDESVPMERGRIVRTLVPRHLLSQYGLPVNPEKMHIPIKADLLIGEDGSTRAVRFVR